MYCCKWIGVQDLSLSMCLSFSNYPLAFLVMYLMQLFPPCHFLCIASWFAKSHTFFFPFHCFDDQNNICSPAVVGELCAVLVMILLAYATNDFHVASFNTPGTHATTKVEETDNHLLMSMQLPVNSKAAFPGVQKGRWNRFWAGSCDNENHASLTK